MDAGAVVCRLVQQWLWRAGQSNKGFNSIYLHTDSVAKPDLYAANERLSCAVGALALQISGGPAQLLP